MTTLPKTGTRLIGASTYDTRWLCSNQPKADGSRACEIALFNHSCRLHAIIVRVRFCSRLWVKSIVLSFGHVPVHIEGGYDSTEALRGPASLHARLVAQHRLEQPAFGISWVRSDEGCGRWSAPVQYFGEGGIADVFVESPDGTGSHLVAGKIGQAPESRFYHLVRGGLAVQGKWTSPCAHPVCRPRSRVLCLGAT